MSRRRRALISVSDKTGIVPFAEALVGESFEIVSTGGTAAALRAAGISVTDVSDLTGFPEIMDGRVKTLHPAVHGGLLARRGVDDAVAAKHGIGLIDLAVVNLYPFEQTIAEPNCTVDDAIENIDVGGPAMLRAAAKNHDRVCVVVDAADYAQVLAGLREGGPSAGLRRRLAAKAYAHTARYDAAIAGYLVGDGGGCPDPLVVGLPRAAALRYGENPHQPAALYLEPGASTGSVAKAAQRQGKPLSYNNLVDADTALRCARAFDGPACVIVKHANPCGVAVAGDATEAYRLAYDGDPTSAFGGVIAFNGPLEAETAQAIVDRQFAEVIVAPAVAEDAAAVLARKPNIRVLESGPVSARPPEWEIRTIEDGLLCQRADDYALVDAELRLVTARPASDAELDDLRFAWLVAGFVKSNAIVYARGRRTLGIGAGQMSRVVSARIAAQKAAELGLSLEGAAMASDAFFPFRDGIDAAAEHGIAAVIQPGGSLRDDEVVGAADEHGMTMLFTGRRHFRH